MSEATQQNRAHAEWLAQRFKEIDWLVPAYLTIGFLSRFAGALDKAAPERRLEMMRLILSAVYTPEYLATTYLERYSTITYVRDFARQIDEAIKAYFSGFKLAAITTLVPVIEGISGSWRLSKIAMSAQEPAS
jgi:hypothetical protein